MRILTLASLFPTGLDPTHGIFIYQRTAHLAKRPGNEVVVVSPVPCFPRWARWVKTRRWRAASELPAEEQVGILTVYHPRYFLLPKIWMPLHAFSMFLGCWRHVTRLARQAKIDCLDAHFVYPDGLAAVLMGRLLKLPVTVSARGTDINLYPTFRLIRPMIRWTLRQADGVIAVSGALRDVMVGLGVCAEKIHVIPNGVDAARFQPVAAEEARRQLGLENCGPILVSVGSLIPSKGHQLLIRAIRQVAARHAGLRLYIIGEGPYRPELESLVRELKLQDQVQLVGNRANEELRFWFSAATASCLASTREGWPNAVTESLACGTPVVATRVGGTPEILHSLELGVLVEQTSESIADGLEEALSKQWDREKISRQTRARTWEEVAAEVEDVLAAQLRERNQRPARYPRKNPPETL